MKVFTRLFVVAIAAGALQGQAALAQTATPVAPAVTTPTTPTEVKLRGVAFTDVVTRLFGADGLLTGTKPFELKADRVTLTAAQAQSFFTPTAGTATSPDFATLVSRVQQKPGTEVTIRGFVETTAAGGGVIRTPFEAKVEAGEVKVRGLSLTQTQFDALVTRLQTVTGAREVKVEALVNGRRVEAKLEHGVLREKIEGSERRGRGREGTSATINADRATDRGRDLDHAIRGRDRAELERAEKAERVEKAERAQRPERLERPERIERADRPERIERVERVERAERPERVERVERAERPERVERVERAERQERVERPERSGRR